MPNNNNQDPKPQTKVEKKFFSPEFKLKIYIALLIIILIVSYIGGAYLGYKGYQKITNQNELIGKLESEKNNNTEDYESRLKSQSEQIEKLTKENNLLKEELNSAKAKIEELTPKDIRDLDFKALKSINSNRGDFWLNPIYADLNKDGRLDGIYAYRLGGYGNFLNVYVYAYLNGNNLTEILKAEGYLKGQINFEKDNNILVIISEAGTPDSPNQISSKFKWDGNQNKMILIEKVQM